MIGTILPVVHHSFHYPTGWQTKRLVLTLKNEDDLCFKYSVQCGFYEIYKKDHPCDMYHSKKYVDDKFIKWDNIDFPVGNNEIELFEEQNKHISVNVYYINPDMNSQRKFNKKLP